MGLKGHEESVAKVGSALLHRSLARPIAKSRSIETLERFALQGEQRLCEEHRGELRKRVSRE